LVDNQSTPCPDEPLTRPSSWTRMRIGGRRRARSGDVRSFLHLLSWRLAANSVMGEMESGRKDLRMSLMGKAHLVILCTVDSGDEGEWDRIFASHGEWMAGHPREGDVALLSYTISKGPERSNPLDPSSEPTGKTIYVLNEYYEAPAGVARHWEETMEKWADLGAVVQASTRATVSTLHSGTVVNALW
jgi:hypothetical protein